jgi:hypothetical protein
MQHITAMGHFYSGRYDEAWPQAEMACRERPNFLPSIRLAAASNALSGRLDEARGFIVRALQLDPELHVSNLKHRIGPFRPDDSAKLIEGLRKAGLPE